MKTNQNLRFYWRKTHNKLMLGLSYISVIIGLFWLCWILFTLITKGIPALSIDLFTQSTPAPNEKGGIVKCTDWFVFFIVGVGTLIGTPIGYWQERIWQNMVVIAVSHKLPVFLMIFFFLPLLLLLVCLFTAYMYQKSSIFSGWAGAFALALLLIPIVVRTTDNMLLLVPNNLREAAAALGCSQWQVIMMICYRAAKSGILTGVLLAVARISGETAPLLFTALSNQFLSWNMNEPIANLPVVIYQYAASPFTDWNNLAWAGAALITLFVLCLNIFTRLFFQHKK